MMFFLKPLHIIGFLSIILLITVVSVFSGKKVKSANDFITSNKRANSWMVTGTITGVLVGGASTIGTTQLAFQCGMSAWWFTLGEGIACLLLFFLIRPLKESKVKSIIPSCIFSSAGMFISVVAQLLSLVALISSMFPLNPLLIAFIGIILMATYISFGGIWGSSLVGIIKIILIYIFLTIASIFCYKSFGSISNLKEIFPHYPWFSLFGRGFIVDSSALFSTLVGVISTQTCIQAVLSGKNISVSRKGVLLSAFLIPPTGIAGILIGFYMRANYPDINSAQALPLFIIKHFNPLLSGMALATLLIAATVTGASLILGISTMFTRDIYPKFFRFNEKSALILSRLTIIIILFIALLFVKQNLYSLIIKWNFLSMGLRGTTIFFKNPFRE
jgi:SSS family solute:Na+ symporter